MLLSFAPAFMQRGYGQEKHRVIILSDIEADPDDSQSFVRLLLYANTMDIEGLVATTSIHQQGFIAPESITKLLEAYAKVHPNLLKHEPGYPEAAALMALVKKGQPGYGMKHVGKGHDSEGSDLIIKALEKDDKRPVWVSVWGGVNTLAQALYKIKETKSSAEAKRLTAKLRVYTISDQDDSGSWIRKTFPDVFYIVTPGGYGKATWGGINLTINSIDNTTVSNAWLAENIQQGHGPLGAMYPDVGYGMEGDTPAFLGLIPNGLNDAEHPNKGGWGGRYELYKITPAELEGEGFTGGVPFEPETRPIWTNAFDTYQTYTYSPYGRPVKKDTVITKDNKVTLWRWRDDFQNDFAARMDWCTKPYEEANHPPVAKLGHADKITVTSGEMFTLSAAGSTDPDGDSLSYLWLQYNEIGTSPAIPFLTAENLYRVVLKAPEIKKAVTAHFVLKVTDKGTPALTKYKRVEVLITP
ncbi:hypothetical protein AM493_11965 [Flavobacterium akiainvivens]|uniref:Uncharacterized protein n=1 Tax=Flavobacterium akiainvivens TaxID=1202724 RepID=A0A0N0RR59_9FLAO|nr:hypothetical protein AM493_11965 [Flavobacterium akiainvivens]